MSSPRWEKTISEYMKNADKYRAMKKEIEDLKAGKVTGDFKTKEEYEKALAARKKEISEKEATYKKYETFAKNADKIKNVIEYRKDLEEKLSKLESKTENSNNKITENDNKIKQLEAEQQKTEKHIQEQNNLIDKYLEELNNGKGSPEDKAEARDNLERTIQAKKLLEDRNNTYSNELKGLKDENQKIGEQLKADAEKNGPQKEKYERRIAKCNLLISNLLKGKSIDDIELRVEEEGKKFTLQDGKLKTEIENEKTSIDDGKSAPSSKTSLAKVSEFSKKHPRLAKIGNFFKNIKDKVVEKIMGEDELEEDVEKQGKEDKKGKEEKKAKVEEDVAKMFEDEDKLLKAIAEKGKEKTFRDMVKVNRTKTANELAKKHGGAYERQDGATAKKDKSEDKGMEPGE